MSSILIIKLPTKWKAGLWLLLAGGTALSISYWVWLNRRSASDKGALIIEPAVRETPDIRNPSSCRNRHPGRTASISSRTSTVSGLRLLNAVPHQNQPVGIRTMESDEITPLSDKDWGRLGLRTLVDVVDSLEGLMARVRHQDILQSGQLTDDSQKFIDELRKLLEQAYGLRERYKQKLIVEDPEYNFEATELDITSDDDTSSFFSAVEQLDLTELEQELTGNFHRPLYRIALKALDKGEIHYRAIRTQLVGCEKDLEYLAKLHCLRQAFDYIFSQIEPTKWLCSVGKLLSMRLLHCLDYPSADFAEAYERLMTYIASQRSSPQTNIIADEVLSKGVKVVNFYDVVIDLILIEALALLSDPPSYILSVTRHRWLSDTFKRTALDSTIWTILLAKRKLLKYADGLYAHLYAVTGTVAPALAWGFLGTDEGAQRTCGRLRDLVIAFVKEAFVFYDQPRASSSSGSFSAIISRDSREDTEGEASGVAGTATISHRENSTSGEQENSLEDGDDTSTLVLQSPNQPETAVSPLLQDSPVRPQQIGLRYTTVPELSEDLYNLMISTVQQQTRMLIEEARFADRPLPDELCANPSPPALTVTTK